MSTPLLKMFSHLPLGLKFYWKEKEGQRRVTHPTTTLVTHGRERIKRTLISSLLTLIKNHQVKVSHQVITFTIPLLQDQVLLNVLNVLGYNHIALNCPTKRTMILKKSNDVESEHSSPHSLSKESSSSSKTKIFKKDPMLLRRMIGKDQSELEPTQRENIFSI